MRIDERHQGQEAVVGDAEDADLAVGFGNVFDQPVDGVVGVGGVVDRRGIERAVQRAIHDVVAFGAVFAAHILDNANVAAFDDDVGGVVVAVEDWGRDGSLRVGGEAVGVVGRAREQDRRVLGAFRDEDDGVQLDAVAHGDHDIAALEIETGGGLLEMRGSFAREIRIFRLLRGSLRVRGPGEKRGAQKCGGDSWRGGAKACDAIHAVLPSPVENCKP